MSSVKQHSSNFIILIVSMIDAGSTYEFRWLEPPCPIMAVNEDPVLSHEKPLCFFIIAAT